MKLIESSYKIIEQEPGLTGVYKQIEKAARTSYKSENKIAEGTAEKMVDSLIKRGHLSCLEHGTIYLEVPMENGDWVGICGDYDDNPYSIVKYVDYGDYMKAYITTNARVIFENGWQEDLQYLCEPTEFHEKRISVKFTASIGTCREIMRYKVASYTQESTRYCNYANDKFGNELTFIIPQWIYDVQLKEAYYVDSLTKMPKDYLMRLIGEDLVNQLSCEDRAVAAWVDALERTEKDYMYLISGSEGYKLSPQEARGILPLDLKSDVFVTGSITHWKHFFEERSYLAKTGKPHPDIQILADGLMEEFLDRNYITKDEINKLLGQKLL